MKCNASLGRTRLTGHYSVNKLSMTEILFGTPNSKTKGSLGLLLKISTENPDRLRKKRLRWFSQVKHENSILRQAMELEVEGRRPVSRPKKTWGKVVEKDMGKLNILENMAEDIQQWR